MANSNAPTGLTPRRYRNGSPWMGACRTYYVPATDATAIGIGDPVIIAGGADAAGVPTVTLATAGATNRITGVCVGIRPGGNSTLIPPRLRAASTAEYILVTDDPALLYEVQEDSVGGALTAASTDLNCDLVAGTASTYTGLSAWQLDSSTAAVGATLQMRLIGLQIRADNVFGANAKWLASINLPTETGAAGSTGV
jgi:hypothetical protein